MHDRVRRVFGLAMVFALLAAVFVLPAAPAAALASWPTLNNGDRGPNVTSLQYLLRHRGYSLTIDGSFGPATESVVRSFQSANGLAVDGVVGPNTWSKLVVTLRSGDNNNAVRGLQTQLNKFGHGLTIDGSFGPATYSAVRSFQSSNGLSVDGIAGPQTWQQLLGSGASTSKYVLPIARSVLPRSEYDDPHHDYPAIDLPTVTGTRAYAMVAGTVAHVGSTCGYGVRITTSEGYRFTYCHFNSRSVAHGATVTAGQLIGYTGNTGNSTGPHLHLAIEVNGVKRCPQRMLLALYDGTSVPSPANLPTSGCTY